VLAGPADPVIQRHWIELPAQAVALCAQAQMTPWMRSQRGGDNCAAVLFRARALLSEAIMRRG
jgi:hypothetical protein